MLRYLIFAMIAYVLYRILRKGILKGIFGKTKEVNRGPSGGVIDELVQDAYCRIYIPRRDSVKRVIGGEEHFFCSEECATKFELERRGQEGETL